MPHLRDRQILLLLEKRLRFFPVVAIQGARQTGKSVLARQIVKPLFTDAHYLSLDSLSVRENAQESPQTFLAAQGEYRPVIIDEAQKAPALFDAIKFEVDQDRHPGRFLLLGSTEFSRLALIRESLTGRMGRVRLFPLNLREIHEQAGQTDLMLSRQQLLKYLEHGGMPGIFATRDAQARALLWEDWIQLTCQRDIHQFKALKLDGELAYLILRQTCLLEEPTAPAISRAIKQDARRVQTHLKALVELFALQRLMPHPSGTGKPIYLPLDPGLVSYFEAPLMRRLHVALMNERLTRNAYSGEKAKTFYYYRSTNKRWVHWVEETPSGKTQAWQIHDSERIKKIDAELMKAFLVKNPKAKGQVLCPSLEKLIVQTVSFLPWETIPNLPI